MALVRTLVSLLLWLVVAAGLAITIVPRFLDRTYYRGPVSDHFDGAHFFNPDGADDVLSGPAMPAVAARFLTGRDDRPVWPRQVAVAQAKPAARVDGDAMVATWVGHASVLVQTQGLNILTDPVWSDTAGPLGIGPRRVAAPGIAFDDLPPIDVVLISHNHYDHLDRPTLRRLWARDRPLIVTSLGNEAVTGVPTTALDWGGRVAVKPGVEVVVTRNHHWGSRWFTDRNRALWSSFVVRLPGGNLFFAGDTGAGDLKWADEAAALGPVRLALLPIGAFRFREGQMGTGSHIGPAEAVEVFRRLGAPTGIAVHWGTFRLSYEGWATPPRLLRAAMACSGQRGFIAVPIGVAQAIPAYGARPTAAPVAHDMLLHCLDTPQLRALR
jgi:L-ascorbate metabolism protein UlaG (beta-lactamase superfamily)